MDEFSHHRGLLEVKPVARPLHHDDVVLCKIGEGMFVELDVVDDLPLEGVSTVEHEAGPLKRRVQARKAVNVLLVVVDCLQVHLEGRVSIEIEEEGGLQHLVADHALYHLDGLGQGKALQAPERDR